MEIRLAMALMLAATSACRADVDGIQNHEIQRLFMEQPCTAVISTIDTSKVSPKDVGMMTMAFGFLMGFEADHPGIRGDHETILMRLRSDCARDGTITAFAILKGYAAE